MSKVKAKDSKIELLFRKKLWNLGFNYRKNSKKYFGKPDLILNKYKAVVFIDSCFWHGCKKHCRMPSSKKQYWIEKIKGNIARDRLVTKHYRKIGWSIFRFWGHEIKNDLNRCVNKVVRIKTGL